jgi:hypothetical protein
MIASAGRCVGISLGFAILLMFVATVTAAADCPGCGPLYCINTPEYRTAVAQKKKDLLNEGNPARLIALFDKVAPCQGCIDTSPAGFSVFTVGNDGAIDIRTWTKNIENAGAAAVQAHNAKACYVIIARRTCSCCKEPRYNERPDYDGALDLNKGPTLACQ